MLEIFFAVLAGMLTIAAPCILPVLPIILGANVGSTNKKRPLFIVLGFVLMFCSANLLLYGIISAFQLSPDILRQTAIWLLGIFGIFLIWPLPFELLTRKLNSGINKANQIGQNAGSGNWGGFVLGVMLGVIWAPCAGPVLGAILTNIARTQNLSFVGIQLFAYSLGAGIPMLAIAYGGQAVSTKIRFLSQYSKLLQQIFGVLILALAVAMYFGVDTQIQAKLLEKFPAVNLEERLVGNQTNKQIYKKENIPETKAQKTTAMEKIKLANYGPAPEFAGIEKWLNLPEDQNNLTLNDLKGKVILVDFWTYSCINCIRTLPYVTKWHDTYKDKGFVVVGVHTPEFAFEQITANVKDAIKRFKISYPVAQDNNFSTWNNYNNQYWPAKYLIDQQGNIVYTHFGEGEYERTENIIRQLLEIGSPVKSNNEQDLSKINSPEMYFGTNRLQNLTETQTVSTSPQNYTLPKDLKLNTFALGGVWQFFDNHVRCVKNCTIKLRYDSSKVFLVASSDTENDLNIVIDGEHKGHQIVKMSQLYPLQFSNISYGEHIIEIYIEKEGLEAFTFTFG